MNNENVNKKFALEERTAKFGENTIKFCQTINQNIITKPIINQVIRSSTSIGANYMEANAGSSKKDFKDKIHLCKKETQETKHWLRMIATAVPEQSNECRILWQEAQELTLIFEKIISSLNKSKLNQNS